MTQSRGFSLVCIATFVVILIVFAVSPGTNRAIAQGQGTSSPTESATASGTQPACTDLLQAAIAATDKGCANTGRNQVCYGNVSLKAEPQPGIADFTFDQPGQSVPISSIQKLELSSLDTQGQTWGVALMRVQANLPDSAPGQNVTMILFGDVSIQDASVTGPTLDATIASDVTPRQLPIYGLAGQKLTANTPVKLTGRLADGSWLRIQVVSSGQPLWIPAKNATVATGGDLTTLTVVKAGDPGYGPYQAFTLRTGTGQAGCSDAPRDGVMIQSPKGGIRVNLNINGAQVSLGSTIVVRTVSASASKGNNSSTNSTASATAAATANPGGESLAFTTVEGSATIQAAGKTQVLAAGNQLEVPIDTTGIVSGPPGLPHVYLPADVQGLPVSVLPNKIVVKVPQACPSGMVQSYSYSLPALPAGVSVPGYSSGGSYTAPCYCANGSHTISKQGFTSQICN